MSRFLRLAFVASTAAAALSLTVAPAYAAPSPDPPGCTVQRFVLGAMSTCAPGSANTHQVEMVCLIFGFPANVYYAWGPEVPTFLPSVSLCPPVSYGFTATVHLR
ncbi:hypothetical protein [Rhodococcus opacus]|jgi:hypothetical protein|uniref:Secreted protein n=1 Tax=Rhodococcus opacus TaxID=37919 RepID=A0A2S8I9D5_RHOOP|nr:hypothetical protein [Rhodococcus opacus]PQP11396.1 hypothetical protein C5613_43425 [Rhodococcus opacus]